MSIHILGIRHHGPGSARNVKAFLEELKPDIVLVEGPPEGDPLIGWATHEELKPPVALLVYQPDDPQHAVFYPFAEFSPEWQAIQYAKSAGIPVRFMDLPAVHGLALKKEQDIKEEEEAPEDPASLHNEAASEQAFTEIKRDPVSYLAEAAGYEDGEQWWEQMFEHRLQNEQVFEAVAEAMQALREVLPAKESRREQLREAWMRKVIRQAERELFTGIAVICGAWHAPALKDMPKVKEDNELLKSLPKVKVECTWVPWTYSRLTWASGYGAGIASPGWYEHVWRYPEDDGTRWMSRVAGLFRERSMDTSVAHVIEAVRLAESLASLRGFSKAGLDELNEATRSVLCHGEEVLMQLIHDALIVSNKIGSVPADIPKPPLQVDIEKAQKRLRMPPAADWKDYMLDLRKEHDLERSIFLHRLTVLGIRWGQKSEGGGKGTFREPWRLQWRPELYIDIIEKGTWGNTLEEAASAWILQQCKDASSLQEVTDMLQEVIPAALAKAAEHLAIVINNMAAATNDVLQLIRVIPGLARIVRYGNVRRTDADMVLRMLDSMITRVCIGLPMASCGIDEDTASGLTDDCVSMQHSVQLLQQEDFVRQWQQCLQQIAYNGQAAPMLKGFAIRQLMDYKILGGDILYQLFYSSLSRTVPPGDAAAWLEGFLKGRGTVLLIDQALWEMVDGWIKDLEEETFTQILPLLRRTFAAFSPTERRKMGEKVKSGGGSAIGIKKDTGLIDHERAKAGLPIVLQLLGMPPVGPL